MLNPSVFLKGQYDLHFCSTFQSLVHWEIIKIKNTFEIWHFNKVSIKAVALRTWFNVNTLFSRLKFLNQNTVSGHECGRV